MEKYWKGLLLTLLYISSIVAQDDPLNLHVERLHSFKGPFGSGRNAIYYWEHGGSTMITENYVRLTPSQPSKVGYIWNFQPVYFSAWEVIISFQVSGARLGADGFAFWYVAEPKKEGPVFGYQNPWKGVGILFDTYDNDGSRNNPYISVFVNDGTRTWDGGKDGAPYANDAGCISHFRNTKSSVKITYKDSAIEVSIDVGERGYYQTCTRVPAQLPPGYYFGLTAATGAVHDAHDIYSVDTYNLGPKQPLYNRPPRDPVPQQQEQHQQQDTHQQQQQQEQHQQQDTHQQQQQEHQQEQQQQEQHQQEQQEHQQIDPNIEPIDPPRRYAREQQQDDTETELHQATQQLQQQIQKQQEQEQELRQQLQSLQYQLQQLSQQPPQHQAVPELAKSKENDIFNIVQQLSHQLNGMREDINVLKQSMNGFDAAVRGIDSVSQKLGNIQRDATNILNTGAKKLDVDPAKVISELEHKVNEIRNYISSESTKLRNDLYGKIDNKDYSPKFRDLGADLNHLKHSLETIRSSMNEAQGSSWKLWLVIFIAVVPLYLIQLCAKLNKRKPASLRL